MTITESVLIWIIYMMKYKNQDENVTLFDFN